MILFHRDRAHAILEGRKMVTRRPCVRGWTRPRVKVGNEYQARTSRFGKPFARLRVERLTIEPRPMNMERCWVEADEAQRWRTRLTQECEREGFGCYKEFAAVWVAMHGDAALNESCWRIAFSVVPGSERPKVVGEESK
jgi:hypothetical protein